MRVTIHVSVSLLLLTSTLTFFLYFFFFFNDTATTEIYTLSLHDALPIFRGPPVAAWSGDRPVPPNRGASWRSEEHTSELQSQSNLVCRLLLEKKKNMNRTARQTPRAHAKLTHADRRVTAES